MRLIPSVSPEACVSGQGKQGTTPSGALQCCSASSSVQAGAGGCCGAGAVPHRGAPRCLCGCHNLPHPSLWLRRGCRRVWAAQVGRGAEALAATTACGMVATEVKRGAATGHTSSWLTAGSEVAAQAQDHNDSLINKVEKELRDHLVQPSPVSPTKPCP